MNIFILHASPRSKDSTSRQISGELLTKIREKHKVGKITTRDLNLTSLPHVDEEMIQSYFTPPSERTPQQEKKIQLSDELVDELLDANIIIISTPMWNFSVPSHLKAWIDHIVRAGRTFSFATGKPEGLLKDKKVIVVTSSGSVFSEGPFASYDFVVPYFRALFGFLGMTDLQFIRVEGLNDPSATPGILSRKIIEAQRIASEF